MDIVIYTQYYRCKTAVRQREIDECLLRNLNHPAISKVVLFQETDAPPLPQASVPLEVVERNERITYAEWFRWVQRQGSGSGLLLNADIYLDEGLEHLAASLDSPDIFLALTRYNPGHAGFHLNDYPHWTQDVWGVRADAELPESLLYASSFPLGFPGCDNRIAYVMWSHGFRVRNPCYHVRSVHLQASTARDYGKTRDRLYGGVSYIHPSLAPDEDAELEFTLWTSSQERPAGVLVNQQVIEQGVHQLRHGEAEVAQRFLDQQQFTGLAWVHEAVGSAYLNGDLHPFASEDTVFLPMPALLGDGVSLQLRQPARVEGLSLRLPRRAQAGYQLELQAEGEGEARLMFEGDTAVALKAGAERRFWQPPELKAHRWIRLRLKLVGAAVDAAWRAEEGAELVLFGEEGCLGQAKSLSVIAGETPPSPEAQSRPTAYSWRRRSECTALLEQGEELHCYGSRFRVLSCGDELVFDDRFWPSVGVSPLAELPCELGDRQGLFLWGFGQPTLELRPDFIANTKRFSADRNFWQYPCRTEGDAFAVHQRLAGPQVKDGVLQLYVGLPWATWIDRNSWPISTLKATANRLRKLRLELGELGLGLKVHSVCQHILWRDNLHLIKASGVDCLWLSHKPIAEHELENIELRPWHLYAVNIMEPNRREGLFFKSPEKKRYLASFIGAHMGHYISDVRPKLLRFKDEKDWLITLGNEWHFNKIVYCEQAEKNVALEARASTQPRIDEVVIRYNQVLSDSIFSLCPAGAGPNSLRLWESLAVGSIPVILSDKLVMPKIPCSIEDQSLWKWEDIVIFHSEEDLDGLESRLRNISLEEIKQRSDACIAISNIIQRKTCSMAFAEEIKEYSAKPKLENQILLEKVNSGLANEKVIVRKFKQQQIHKISSNKSNFTGATSIQDFDLILDPAQCEAIKILHFDRAELVTAIEIISSSTTQFHIVIENSIGFNKYIQVADAIFPRNELKNDKSCLLDLPANGQWSESLRIKACSLHRSIDSERIKIRIGIEIINNALAEEMGKLNTKGSLYRCSVGLVSRHYSLFLTNNIENAKVISSIKELDKDLVTSYSAKVLFPAYPKQPCNLIGEKIAEGISMYIHLMNRNENIKRNLANWLTLSFDELILLDWSTDGGITHLPGLFDDPRVRVARVENQTKFIRTLAQNLASRIARNRKIFKCDSDVEFKGDFFQAHPLEEGEFWVGDWKQAQDHNERHLHGETYYWLEDFLKVGGYDERIKSYGHDDSNFKDRLLLSGLIKKVFDYSFMHHQEHDQKERAQGSFGLHPMVATYANKLMSANIPLWAPSSDLAQFRLLERSTDSKIIKFELVHQASEHINSSYIDEAIRIVGSWYLKPQEIDKMSNDEINAIIWKKQLE
jgi:hypothetical protein